jgi:tRNA pseudouridine32 synthase / 23S rRNA pseudouridine746 synthase
VVTNIGLALHPSHLLLKRFPPLSAQKTVINVALSWIRLPSDPATTVYDFFVARFPHVREHEWRRRFEAGEIQTEHGEPITLTTQYQVALRISYQRSVEREPDIPFKESIVFEDDLILVADKPRFLPVTPGGQYVTQTLLYRLQQRTGLTELSPAHRLDLETAGLVLFTKQAKHRGIYQSLFRNHAIQKEYEAIADLPPSELQWPLIAEHRLVERDGDGFMQMKIESGEPNAVTLIDCIERNFRQEWARYTLKPKTGKKHQLRAQMYALGLPILNDRIYPKLLPPLPVTTDWHAMAALQLLAKRLAFADPVTGVARLFETNLGLCF